MGVEPTRPGGHKILSLACLPVPALPLTDLQLYHRGIVTKKLLPARKAFAAGFYIELLYFYVFFNGSSYVYNRIIYSKILQNAYIIYTKK